MRPALRARKLKIVKAKANRVAHRQAKRAAVAAARSRRAAARARVAQVRARRVMRMRHVRERKRNQNAVRMMHVRARFTAANQKYDKTPWQHFKKWCRNWFKPTAYRAFG